MEQINYKFLNYLSYEVFKRDLENNVIREDSLVFIQDVLRIWARGKEYVCSGLTGSITPTEDGVGSVITLQDAFGNSWTTTVTNKSTIDLLIQAVEGMHTTVQSLSSNVNELSTTIDNIQESVNDLSTLPDIVTEHGEEIDDINRSLLLKADLQTLADGYYTKGSVDNLIKTARVTIDSNLSNTSINPVENRAILEALNNKLEQSDLSDYITINNVQQYVSNKQNQLEAGYGISIDGNTISVTLDTDVFTLVDELPTENISENKLYILEETRGGTTTYNGYKYKDGQWIPVGEKMPQINLSPYLKSADAASTYQLKGDYLVPKDLQDFYTTISAKFQTSGNYAPIEWVNAKLEWVQRIIADQYVLKKDVYRPHQEEGWSEAEIIPSGDTNPVTPGGNSGDTSGSSVRNNMVTLSARAYQLLVDANAVDPNTYYFTYEGDDIQSWTFGGTFPITFGSESTGTFPITLT